MIRPPALKPGDRVAVIAPSGPFEPTLGWRGLGWLARRYRIVFSRSIFRPDGYLAGSRHRRADELSAALADPHTRAIVAMRGGYGLHQIAHLPDWGSFARAPKWIVGFSDITALHVESVRAGVMSMHAPMVALLGRGCHADHCRWLEALETPAQPRRWAGLEVMHRGTARGTLFGGNLTVLHACAVTGRLRVPEDAILLLEDVTERPYRIDRMLTTLLVGGHLKNVRGVALGQFTECHPGADGVRVDRVLRDVLSELRVPVIAGLPVGHGLRNEPIVIGARATLEADAAAASLLVEA